MNANEATGGTGFDELMLEENEREETDGCFKPTTH